MGAVSSQLSSGAMVGMTESGDVEQTSKLLVTNYILTEIKKKKIIINSWSKSTPGNINFPIVMESLISY